MSSVERFQIRGDDDVGTWMRLEKESTDEPFPILWTPADVSTRFTKQSEYEEVRGYVCRDDAGELVGWGLLRLPMAENATMADGSVGVAMDRRRQGHGTALANAIRRDALAAGRTTLMSRCSWPADAQTSAGRRFAEHQGLSCGNTLYHQVLSLPADPDRLHRTAEAAAHWHPTYRIISWQSPCPAEWLDRFAEIQGRMNDEVPLGDIEIEAEEYDGRRVRDDEEMLAARGLKGLTTAAVGPDGTLAGFTQLVVSDGDDNAFQWDTLVLPEHRGHRLGLAVKARNLLELTALGMSSRVMHTWNAVTNQPMIAVNDAFGFRPADYRGEFQGRL